MTLAVWSSFPSIQYNHSTQLYWYCVFAIFVPYFSGCALAGYFFVSNLSKLIKARVTASKEVNTAKDVELDQHQQKLSDLSAKYMLLFLSSILSTMLIMFLSFA